MTREVGLNAYEREIAELRRQNAHMRYEMNSIPVTVVRVGDDGSAHILNVTRITRTGDQTTVWVR